jgi:hypothetical protein
MYIHMHVCMHACMYVCSLMAREWIHQFVPNLFSWVWVLVRVVPVARKLSVLEEWCQDQSHLLGRGDYRNNGHKPGKLPWVQVPVKVVSVAWKLSTIEKRRWDQSCLFQRGDYMNKGQNPEKLLWVRIPVRMLCSLEARHDRMALRPKLFVSAGHYRNIVYKPENCPGFESRWRCSV